MQELNALAFPVRRWDRTPLCQTCGVLCAAALDNCGICAKVPVSTGPLDSALPAPSALWLGREF